MHGYPVGQIGQPNERLNARAAEYGSAASFEPGMRAESTPRGVRDAETESCVLSEPVQHQLR
jgi:hypothetical protein